MQGKILIVDAIATNRIILKVKLRKVYYDVSYATSMQEAIAVVREELPGLVISAFSLPDGSAAELCHVLATDQATDHIPVIAIGQQEDAEARMAALEVGVRDVFSQPVDETLLMGRVRSLIRAHNTTAEWRMREDTCRALGLAEPETGFEEQCRCVLVSSDTPQLQKFAMHLRPVLRAKLTLSSAATLMAEVTSDALPDVFVLVLPENASAAVEDLRLISTLRANASARHTGVIVLQTAPDAGLGAQALDLGADDLMAHGFDAAELSLRIKAVMRRKRMGEQLRASVRTGLQAAVFDPLTGVYNRRYAMPHLARICEHADRTGRTFAVMLADLDHFKRINDVYGHSSGDAVLVEVANRLRRTLRSSDMVARVGGEEFLVIMPAADLAEARKAALRLCGDISSTPFIVPGSATPIAVTVSIGMAIGGGDTGEHDLQTSDGQTLLEEADSALYAAKGRGRNQVNLGRPAA
ncbi:diguanylate cyclase [Sulfitobacter sp. M57]|uniref:diguanylate cyclase n=1 Tax=unclassified Sulfitobacter TaxID=196795 RepID=UPI0023E31306|nr:MULTISPECIES: diguanylate cyclase [unclassified Sulfitobacter]MDF3414236.1 diguanylate cyclase [Sulfitobacter sp. KE5]MDF3420482.1 diguanylate cyclase [Sulfitobacter sp. KE43]MDF3432782.1 diguanylate cyclase [Sulfitobacter sp. KE42]MDF3458422.1 diguanylate cyclase [Sulfitobacter sp. S74]MDF3462322.1 diguanylate cyclase [Sulfitobacter sp. Ks18]